MATEHVIGRPIPLDLDLSLLSERVLNSLSREGQFTKEDKVVLKKAATFLEEVERGGKAMHSLELGATTTREIASFAFVMNAYEILGKRNLRVKDSPIRMVAKLHKIANLLSEGNKEAVSQTDITTFINFFKSTKETSMRHTAGEIDRVHLR